MTPCFVALGSNLGDPLQQVLRAFDALDSLTDCHLRGRSALYQNPAVGPGEQPDYINAVAALDSDLSPHRLLAELQQIENAQGRERGERWAARTLDLDLLLYGDRQLDDPELTVPHPRMHERPFVLYPLYDLAPTLTLPCGTRLASLLTRCPMAGMQRLNEPSNRGA